ncbi:unnamed protein product [Cuscuta epithymum]|uniref:WRKY domain-containing protein n=1 Tax=Cuscuta epithymum TaxID=186058 RepID=A0AAV0F802_9ASTE|nr:unnamed protein product [Cuscuta epithymum]
MDEEKDKADRGVDDLTSTDSSWAAALGGGCDTDAVYFFGTGLEKDDGNLLGDFGWSFRAENGGGFARMDSDLAGNCASNDMFSVSASSAAANATPSDGCAEPAAVSAAEQTSSSSSDDAPEKSAASGGSTSRPPADTVGKVKKKGQARMKQPRFAFMTKSEVDHLEDGYRWRKYGQKAVKNSPFPRSYYRCTNTKCTVKKRVERSSEDPTIVITTYEGQHCHHTVGFPRGGGFMGEAGGYVGPSSYPFTSQFYLPPRFHFPREEIGSLLGMGIPHLGQKQGCGGGNSNGAANVLLADPPQLPPDEGLLGDMVPPGIRNKLS